MNLEFDPLNPFPLIDILTVPYALQKEHARQADSFFGFQIDEIEQKLRMEIHSSAHSAQWIGLKPESLQTPYSELRFLLNELELKKGDAVVDLGAAYGRMGLVMGKHFPEAKFAGFEIAPARVDEGNRIYEKQGVKNSKLVWEDVSKGNFQLPEARAYFLYDLSERTTIEIVIDQLREKARLSPICVVGRGRATRDQIERKEPWLSQIIAPKHFGNFSIYGSA